MIRILLCTCQPVLEAGLRSLLADSEEFEFLARPEEPASDGLYRPDLVLLDAAVEGVLDMAARLSSQAAVLLWVHSIGAELAFQALERGVRGIIRKSLSTHELLACFRHVAAGGMWFERDLSDHMIQGRTVSLTRRESQLVALLAQGLKNKEIAAQLLLSEGSVKVYFNRLFRKLGVADRFELALYGLRNMAQVAEYEAVGLRRDGPAVIDGPHRLMVKRSSLPATPVRMPTPFRATGTFVR